MFLKIDLSQRNLFELSVVCFLICVASKPRALAINGVASNRNEIHGMTKSQAA